MMMRFNPKPIAPQWDFLLLLLLLVLGLFPTMTRSSSFEQPHQHRTKQDHRDGDDGTTSSTTTSTNIPSPQDYLVQGLADIEPAFGVFEGSGGSMYAGLVPTKLYSDLSNRDKKEQEEQVGELMFWLFAPAQPKFDDTLIIWNNGGPGCSSLSGALFENSPVTIPRYPAGTFYRLSSVV